MFTKHVLIAKSVVTLLIGALFGYAIAGNVARDAARGRALTKDAYVADFERFKAKLETSEVPTPVAIVSGVVMALGAFGIYELLALGLAKAIGAVAGRLGEGETITPSTWAASSAGVTSVSCTQSVVANTTRSRSGTI